MRLHALDITRFGTLVNRRFELDPRAVVVFGPNEAGKSSFHAAFETALYGFTPANRDAHPYAFWEEEGTLELLAELEFDEAGPLVVERILRASPGTRTATSREELDGPRKGNAPLPGLEAFPRTLFRAVYSLTANDTTMQRDEVREHVQELLLGERGLADARPIREVRAALAEDLGELWRPNERGKPRSKALRAELRATQKAEREARKQERSLREEAIEQAGLLAEREQLVQRRDVLRRADSEADFMGEVAELRDRMDAVVPLRREALAGSSMEDPAVVVSELAELGADLEGPRARLAAEAARLPLVDRMLLGRAKEAEGVLREAGLQAGAREQRAASHERAQGAQRSAREKLGRAGATEPDLRRFAQLDLEPFEQALRAWQTAVADRGTQVASAFPARILLVLALASLVLAATSLAPAWVALGSLAAIPVVLRRDRDANKAPAPAEVAPLLADLDLPAVDSALSFQRVLSDLDDARALLLESRREQGEVRRLDQEIAARDESWRRIAEGVIETEEDLTGFPARLELALTGARQREAEVKLAREGRERDEQHVAAHVKRERKLQARIEVLNQALAENFQDLSPAAAHAAWCQTEKSVEYVRQREAELREDPRWDALAGDPRLELEDDERPWSAAARNERDEELVVLDARLEELRERRGAIGAHLDGDAGSAVAEAAERVTELEAELRETLRQRDRLALLERILIKAERDHRQAHQPDVLRRAGEYLELVTDGRYTGLSYPDGDEGDLYVQPADREEPVPVDPPLSRGTREQIYLCLRLGTLDDLDRERERLPLILDEALVHWDEGRRGALYPVLQKVAERRQVILFTCHQALADEARDGLSAAVIDLSQGALTSRDQPPVSG